MEKSVLAVWTDVTPEGETGFNEWYTHEHVASRVDIPGFLNGFRYRASAGRPKYFAWYETESVQTLNTPEYQNVLENPSPWTRQIMPSFRNTIRCVFKVWHHLGRGHGGYAATFRLSSIPGREAQLLDWLAGTALQEAVKAPGITGAQIWVLDSDATGSPIKETVLRGAPDATVECAVLVEGTDASSLREACRVCLSRASLRQQGAGRDLALGLYRLLYGLGF